MTIKDSVDMPFFRENGMKIILYENGNDSLNSIIITGVAKLKAGLFVDILLNFEATDF